MDGYLKTFCIITIGLILYFGLVFALPNIDFNSILKDNDSFRHYNSNQIKIIRRQDEKNAVSVFIDGIPDKEYIFYSRWVSVNNETIFVEVIPNFFGFLSMTTSDYEKYFPKYVESSCNCKCK